MQNISWHKKSVLIGLDSLWWNNKVFAGFSMIHLRFPPNYLKPFWALSIENSSQQEFGSEWTDCLYQTHVTPPGAYQGALSADQPVLSGFTPQRNKDGGSECEAQRSPACTATRFILTLFTKTGVCTWRRVHDTVRGLSHWIITIWPTDNKLSHVTWCEFLQQATVKLCLLVG